MSIMQNILTHDERIAMRAFIKASKPWNNMERFAVFANSVTKVLDALDISDPMPDE
jgi:hypothetical protein